MQEYRLCLKMRMRSIGYEITVDRGDYKNDEDGYTAPSTQKEKE